MFQSDRPLPADIDAERAVIGAVLTGANLPDDVRLSAADFSRPDLGIIFAATEALRAAGEAVDAVTVAAKLKSTGKLDAAGGKGALIEFAEAAPFRHNLPGYARTVVDRARRRDLIRAALDVTTAAHEADTATEAITTATEAVFALAAPSTSRRQTLAEAVARRLDDYRQPLETVPVTGSDVRLHLGDLVIIGGRPGTGKTAFALQLADVWRRTWPVMVLSYEMSVDELTDRLITRHTGMASALPLDGLSEQEQGIYRKACADLLADERLELVQAAGMPEAEAVSTIRRFAARGGRIVVLDYLQIGAHATKGGTENSDLTRFTRALQQVAKATGTLVLGLSQYSREGASDRPGLHHLRGSGSLEQEAATVGLMWSPEPDEQSERKAELRSREGAILDHENKEQSLVRVFWGKVRHGRIASDYYLFEGAQMKFAPVDYEVRR